MVVIFASIFIDFLKKDDSSKAEELAVFALSQAEQAKIDKESSGGDDDDTWDDWGDDW